MFFLAFFTPKNLINQENAEEMIGHAPHKPVFAVIVQEWCPHCLELEPTWHKLEKLFENDTRLSINTISLDKDRELCQKFSYHGTPNFFWVKTTPEEAVEYQGAHTIEEFTQFIEKHLEPLVIESANKSHFDETLQRYSDNSVMVLYDPDNVYTQEFEHLAENFSSYPTIFVNVRFPLYGQTTLVSVFPKTGETTNCTKLNKMMQFVKDHAIPRFSYGSKHFLKETKKYFLAFRDEKPYYADNLTQLTLQFPKNLKVCSLKCEEQYRLCRVFGLGLQGQRLSLVNKDRNYYYALDGPLDDESVMNFVTKALKGRWQANGPGAGLSGFFYNLKADAKNPAFWAKAIITIILVLSGIVYASLKICT